jgi:hypothetical protein
VESTITHTPCASVPRITGIYLVIPFTGIGSQKKFPPHSQMKRTREQRIALAARKKKAFRAQLPYRTGRAGIGLVIGSGGVAGSGVVRVSASAPLAPEVKYIEGGFTSPAAGTAGNWVTLNNLLAANIVQGTGTNNRIGKNIRIVGIVYRMAVKYGTSVTTPASEIGRPYTIDFIWDKKPTNVSATIQEIYDSAAAGGAIDGTILPNPRQETRFTWQKRIEKAAPNGDFSLVAGSFKCNKFVSYSGNSGILGEQEQNDLIVNFGHCALEVTNRASLSGRIRMLFVDA